MSRTLILAQLLRLETRVLTLVNEMSELVRERQILTLLDVAEVEHATRVRRLSQLLDSIYGSKSWKHELSNETCGIDQSMNEDGLDPLSRVELAESELNRIYLMAKTLARVDVVREMASEQDSLLIRVKEAKSMQTHRFSR